MRGENRVSAGGVVYRAEKEKPLFLLIGFKRRNIWCLPKGLIESGESELDAAQREVKEETGLDVETYVSIYNAMGFLMQVEVDWVHRVITKAKKPVLTIKPMAAGQLRPFQALHFVWSSLRPQDMVAVGTMSPHEAQECIDLSLSILEQRQAYPALQETRSKAAIKSEGVG